MVVTNSFLSGRIFFPFSTLLPVFPVKALHFFACAFLHALPGQTVSDFLSQQRNELGLFISDIMDFLIGCRRPATKPISLTSRLTVNPNLNLHST